MRPRRKIVTMDAKFLSISVVSLENRFKIPNSQYQGHKIMRSNIRPNGVALKKDMGALRRQLNMPS